MQTKDTRHRFQFRFWLDANKDNELLLAEDLDQLKRERSFQPAIRDALRLIVDLRQGRVDVLLRLFPWIEDYFRARFSTSDSPANREFASILERLDKLATHQPILPAGQPVYADAPHLDDLPSMFVQDAQPADPAEARTNFAAGMGDLFSDDDDLFDD